MTDGLEIFKTIFQQEHYQESQGISVFPRRNGAPSLDELAMIDLDAYNYVQSVLHELKDDEEDDSNSAGQGDIKTFRLELLRSKCF